MEKKSLVSNRSTSMSHGIKISKQGFDVTNNKSRRARKSSVRSLLPHLLSALALPYLLGAKKQVTRYQIAASTLKERPIGGVYECLHEASTLFEDLSTISRYVEKCGHKKDIHELWLDVRNHIRHDVREEFDNEDSQRKNERAKRLKLNYRLQTNIGFTIDAIKVGGVVVQIQQVNNYLEWAEDVITSILNDAKKEGYIK